MNQAPAYLNSSSEFQFGTHSANQTVPEANPLNLDENNQPFQF